MTIADNSTDDGASNKIKKLCHAKGVKYLRLPKNPYRSQKGSNSHGAALNWILDKYVLKRKADFFGFIDHDIFPVRPHQILPNLLGKKVYGHIQKFNDKWYLWPGFCFFEREGLSNWKLDFRPEGELDTGARNWNNFYKYIAFENLVIPQHFYGKLRDGNCIQSDGYEMVDNWLHTFNASHWMTVDSERDAFVEKMLLNY